MTPWFREAGAGPCVVCLHSNASSSAQWRGLIDLLTPKFRVLAPDAYGSGKSPEWPSDNVIRLRDEAALIEPVLARAGSPLTLVGHSYGAAVALIAALADPGRVRALALYEPTLFSLLDAEASPPNEAEGIRNAVAAAGAVLDAGNTDAAAECFIDYWMGAGSWHQTPDQRKLAIAGQCAALVACLVHRADAAGRVWQPRPACALHDRPAIDRFGTRRGAAVDCHPATGRSD